MYIKLSEQHEPVFHDGEEFSDDDGSEEAHNKLLKAVSQLYKKQRIEAPKRSEPAQELSEFNLSSSAEATGNKVKLNDLLKDLKVKVTHKEINTKVKAALNRSKTLPKPLEKNEADKINREIGYDNVKKKLDKWNSIVERNRLASQLVFPLQQKPPTKDPPNFLTNFKEPTELEKAMAEVLNKSEVAQEERKIEEDLSKLSIEEMIQRRNMMAKMKARESFRIAKAVRQNKIKSKKYHRVLKKERIKQELKDFEKLQQTDPEAALEKLEQIERTRAEERISLRHRNTGKWAKSRAIRAKYDTEARAQLAEQLAKSRELTRKVKLNEGSSSEGEIEQDEPEDDEPNITNQAQKNELKSNNPWLNEFTAFVKGYRQFENEKMLEEINESPEKELPELKQINGELKLKNKTDSVNPELDVSPCEAPSNLKSQLLQVSSVAPLNFTKDEEEVAAGKADTIDLHSNNMTEEISSPVSMPIDDYAGRNEVSSNEKEISSNMAKIKKPSFSEMPSLSINTTGESNSCLEIIEPLLNRLSEEQNESVEEKEVSLGTPKSCLNSNCQSPVSAISSSKEVSSPTRKTHNLRNQEGEPSIFEENINSSSSKEGISPQKESVETPKSSLSSNCQDQDISAISCSKKVSSPTKNRTSPKKCVDFNDKDLILIKNKTTPNKSPAKNIVRSAISNNYQDSIHVSNATNTALADLKSSSGETLINEETSINSESGSIIGSSGVGNSFKTVDASLQLQKCNYLDSDTVHTKCGAWSVITEVNNLPHNKKSRKKDAAKRKRKNESGDIHTLKASKDKKKFKETTLNDMFDVLEEVIHDHTSSAVKKIKSALTEEQVKSEETNNDEKVETFAHKPKNTRYNHGIDEALLELHEEGISSGVNDLKDIKNKFVASASDTSQSQKEIQIDPNKHINIKPQKLLSGIGTFEEAGEESDDENDKQKMDLMEAFADDDIADQFRKEKNEEAEKNKAEEISLELPGWGSWGGCSIAKKSKRRRRGLIRLPKIPRKDQNKPTVIINENLLPNLREKLVNELPYPYTSVKDFEASLRAPIGNTWVPVKAHRKFITPPVITKMGSIIQPICNETAVSSISKKRRKLT